MKQLKYCFGVLCSVLLLLLVVNRFASIYCNMEIEKTNQNAFGQQLGVSDSQLVQMMMNRISKRYEKAGTESKAIGYMTKEERNIYVTSCFYYQIQAGSLLDYMSQSQNTAPYLLEALGAIHADTYKSLLDNFVMGNRLDFNDLSEFQILSKAQYEKLYEKYSFQEFDEYYKKLQEENSMEEYIAEYIREHLNEL